MIHMIMHDRDTFFHSQCYVIDRDPIASFAYPIKQFLINLWQWFKTMDMSIWVDCRNHLSELSFVCPYINNSLNGQAL